MSDFGTPNEQWQILRDGIRQAGNNHLLVTRHTCREHPWLTEVALQAIEDKGRAWMAYKGKEGLGTPQAKARYNTLKNLARRLVRRDKQAHWEAHAKSLKRRLRNISGMTRTSTLRR